MIAEPQTADAVLLVRPAAFGFHAEAAGSNAFATPAGGPDVNLAATREFDLLASRLDRAGVEMLVLEDSPEPAKPDAVFPNNWVSFHADGTMVLYPMATKARRPERDAEGARRLVEQHGFAVRRLVDLTDHERSRRFLEGTGSLVLDRPGRRAFANASVRTNAIVAAAFDAEAGYSTFLFDARDRTGRPIYHTNVLLSLGAHFAMLCADVVAPQHRDELVRRIEESGRELIIVGYDQMRRFACNLLELRSRSGEPVIATSAAARASFAPDQLRRLERFGELVVADIPAIETVGGGGVRCMIAEVHLPRL